MLPISRLHAIVVPLIALATVLALEPTRAQAQVKPFLVTGKGDAPEGLGFVGGSLYSASGVATQLGKYKGIGIAEVLGFDAIPTDPDAFVTGTFTGGFVFQGKGGNSLVCVHPGTFAVYPDPCEEGKFFAIFDAIFTPDELTIDGETYESTGTFAGVCGGFRMIAVTSSFSFLPTGTGTTPFTFEWNGKGAFKFPKKKK